MAFAAWLLSLAKREVSFVDSLWPLFFLLAVCVYTFSINPTGPRAALVLLLVSIWALRLSLHITWRNWGQGEDPRYQTIRNNNQPRFELKSLYLVFGLQALLAWLISLPLLFAVSAGNAPNWLDVLGIALWLLGMVFEAGGDYQLARFKADPNNRVKVMDQGLWRYTRHPNYFGDFCVWWGFYTLALAAAGWHAWWIVVAPLLMSTLLLKVSGVALTEQTISQRRPAYADYIRRTNAFFPGPRRNKV